MTTTNKPKTLFWVIAVCALIWNIMGLANFLATIFMKDWLIDNYPPDQAELFTGMPSWYLIVFGIATITGVLGCITMLMRKKITVMLFFISLIAAILTQAYWLFGTNAPEVMGSQVYFGPIMVIIICVFLYFYSKGAARKEWLH